MSNKVAAFVFFAGMALVGVEMGQHEDDGSLLVLQHMDDLRRDNPEVDEPCIVVAANIKAGKYNDVQHMMVTHGRCATRLVGLRVTTDYRG